MFTWVHHYALINTANPDIDLATWLGVYEATTPGVQAGDNCSVRLDSNNEPQPDLLLRIKQGGQSRISDDDYVESAPELIVEIAASTASIDLHNKLEAYCRNQVQEYLVWRVYEHQFDWFRLKQGQYLKLEPNPTRIIKSEIYAGLWLDVNGLLQGNLAQLLTVLQQRISTEEHQIFLDKIKSI